MSSPQRLRAVVAMSGGVDSSVTAALLREQGYDVVGITMQLYDQGDTRAQKTGTCCSLDDVHDARRVAEQLGIPFYVANFQDEFRRAVVDDLVGEYLAGRTPNPCVRCNDILKFRLLLRRAQAMGAQLLATGHYARIERDAAGEHVLRRGVDPAKDQSYFLYCVDQAQLAHLAFPVGAMTKDEVRAHAARFGLRTAEKAESQDVCFVAGESYAAFIERHADTLPGPGDIVDAAGARLGAHAGHHRYTVGQRRGLGIASPAPLYVTRIDAAANRVIVGPHDELLARGLTARAVRWVSATSPTPTTRVDVKVRYRSAPAPGTITAIGPGSLTVRFAAPVAAVTPGQTVVLYDGDRVLGGGVIEEALQ